MPALHHVYILFSAAIDKYYIGETADVKRRMCEHVAGNTKSTAMAKDWRLVFLEECPSLREAMALERRIKRTKSRKSIGRYIADERNLIPLPVPLTEYIGA